MTKAAARVFAGKAGEVSGKATGGRLGRRAESNLTDRKKAGNDLRESEERLRLLIDSVQDYAIFMLDPDGRIVSWSKGAERIKGYRAGEIIGRHFSCFYPPEVVAQGKPEWELRTAVEQGRVEDEGWRVRKDGGRFWASIVITALFDKEGRLQGFGKVTRDLTERRRIEELLEADRQKDRFLAVLAHELRNPLAPIWNALHLMKQPAASAQALARAREIAERQMRRLTRLLDDLLDVARLRQGRVELRREVLDIAAVIRSSLDTVQPLLLERRHRLTSAIPGESLLVNGDPMRLEQVLTNLLVNAAKYTDPGGDIFVTAQREVSDVVIRVRDTGIGIDSIFLPRIFDLFVQAHRRLDRSTGGVGVGLALVKSLVELHGGSINVFSAGPGKGSEFIVRLPAAERASRHVGTAQDSDPKPAGRPALRVLIADDNSDQADGLALLLQMEGDDVRISYDGPGVLEAARSFRPQVVLLDIGMPGLDGYQVARRLRESQETRRALLVAMTGWGQEEDLRRSREAGFDHHLTKPFEPALIEKLLADYSAAICP
jgi:PAS domain S-box-containing protein